MINRRTFLLASSAALLSSAVSASASVSEPLIRGIVWQSCPFGAPYPAEFISGQIGPNKLMPLSFWLQRMERHRSHWPVFYWREFGKPEHNGWVIKA